MSDIEDKFLVNTFRLTRSEFIFRQLYRKHTVYLYRLALQLINKDIHSTEDILQETWMRAVENIGNFRGSSSFKTWLSGILINCCREYSRKKRFDHINEDADQQVIWGIDKKVGTKLDLQKALEILPLGYKEILLLHDFEGFKHHEISKLLSISEGTSKSQLFHARNAIKRLLN